MLIASIFFGTDEIVGSVLLLSIIVHVALAIGVLGDAHAMFLEKRYVYLLSPTWWCIITLITGLAGATIYWLMNRSTLRRD